MKVGVGALHRGIGKTKQNANMEVVYGRTVVLWTSEELTGRKWKENRG